MYTCSVIDFSGGGKGNYFGDGSLGHVRVTSAGPQQSADGIVWATIPGWTFSSGIASAPSTIDGDMVVLHCKTLQVDAGYTLTVANRCRGLLIYVQGNATINGSVSMTARGAHANPADSGVSADTPVAPSDGHAVPSEGIIIRRFGVGSGSHSASTLMHGCGTAAVTAEANQPAIGGGLVVAIPRVGGAGGAGVTVAPAAPGGTATAAPGGGGSGGADAVPSSPPPTSGSGGAATCFSGGTGGAGAGSYGASLPANGGNGAGFGGHGGDAASSGGCGGGAGNPGGTNGGYGSGNGETGTGGIVILICGGNVTGSGGIVSHGKNGGGGQSQDSAGGASGGGLVGVLYAVSYSLSTLAANGGAGGTGGGVGGHGGAGAVVGPHKIDPAMS